MKKMKLVMVGNGMAGVRTLEELLKIAPDLYEITVFRAYQSTSFSMMSLSVISPASTGESRIRL